MWLLLSHSCFSVILVFREMSRANKAVENVRKMEQVWLCIFTVSTTTSNSGKGWMFPFYVRCMCKSYLTLIQWWCVSHHIPRALWQQMRGVKHASMAGTVSLLADVMICAYWQTEDGFKMQFSVKHLVLFVLSSGSLEQLCYHLPMPVCPAYLRKEVMFCFCSFHFKRWSFLHSVSFFF